MYREKLKGLEPFIIQFIAMLICGLYVLSPLHKELTSATYMLVHIFEAPKTVLSHQSVTDESHILESVEQQDQVKNHNHELVDFVSDLFKKSNTDDKDDSSIPKRIKLDKHISYNSFLLKRVINIKVKRNKFYSRKQKITKGFLNPIKAPPQTNLS